MTGAYRTSNDRFFGLSAPQFRIAPPPSASPKARSRAAPGTETRYPLGRRRRRSAPGPEIAPGRGWDPPHPIRRPFPAHGSFESPSSLRGPLTRRHVEQGVPRGRALSVCSTHERVKQDEQDPDGESDPTHSGRLSGSYRSNEMGFRDVDCRFAPHKPREWGAMPPPIGIASLHRPHRGAAPTPGR